MRSTRDTIEAFIKYNMTPVSERYKLKRRMKALNVSFANHRLYSWDSVICYSNSDRASKTFHLNVNYFSVTTQKHMTYLIQELKKQKCNVILYNPYGKIYKNKLPEKFKCFLKTKKKD